MTEDTIKRVIASANTLFIHQGYKVTQISQIAKASGIATGSIYHLFENKLALLQFVLRYAVEELDLANISFPVAEVLESDLKKELIEAFLKRLDVFTSKKQGNYSFHEMLCDAFDLISQNASSNLIFEHNLTECGELANAYLEYRLIFFKTMTDYIDYFEQKGVLKPIKRKQLSVRFILETLAFWAMHLPYDALGPNADITPSVAKEVAVETLCSAYLL